MRLPPSRTLRRRHRLPHPVFRRAPKDGTVGLRNPASRRPVRVRGDQVFGERLRATTGNTTSSSDNDFPDDDFFPDVNNLFDNLNMGDNTDAAAAAAAAAPAAPYVILTFLYQILLEFLVLLFGVDAIGLFYLDAICSSTLFIYMVSLVIIPVIMQYQLFIRINSYSNLLIFSTIQKPDYRQMNSSVAAATRPPPFDGSHYKRWRTRVVL